MQEVLLIDSRSRAGARQGLRKCCPAGEYKVYIAAGEALAIQMLRTVVMAAVIVDLSGPQEDRTGIISRILRVQPLTEILYLSAPDGERGIEQQRRFAELLHRAKDILSPGGRSVRLEKVIPCIPQGRTCLTGRSIAHQGEIA